MDDMIKDLAERVERAVAVAASRRGVDLPDPIDIHFERPKREGQGDWSTNAAMKLAKIFKMPPSELARVICGAIDKGSVISSVDAAGPGFINITLSNDWIGDLIDRVISQRDDYGRNETGRGKNAQVEFVSANPTGPIHLGHGRGAAVGDIIASILEFCGWQVAREYYVNDAGLQVEKLGLSLRSRYFAILGRESEAPFPEDGYRGEYMDDIARGVIDRQGDRYLAESLDSSLTFFKDHAVKEILKMIKGDLDDFGVSFDKWFSERSLYEGDEVRNTLDELKASQYAYEQDGALWFASTRFGDDKDRVLIKSGGVPTYFTSDIAYLRDKFSRRPDLIVYVWGADHHGYIPRLKGAASALGLDSEKIKILLIQFVSLLRNGQPVAMSKRAGTYVTLREVMNEVGKDAARFSFVNRRCDSHIDFDLEVAKQTSSENPVYYVQYAHARISGILREAASRGIALAEGAVATNSLTDQSEVDLAKVISRFPEEIIRAARDLEPQKIAAYAEDLAEAFHIFYNTQKVLSAEGDLLHARLALCEASRITIANALHLLGVTAPERM